MKIYRETNIILFILFLAVSLVTTLMKMEDYKDKLEKKEADYEQLNRSCLGYETEYLKYINDIPTERQE